jgi:DNA helicase HerA-like ATPase
MTEPILVAKNTEAEFFLMPQMANRHGVITGATGTGKTVTLQKLAEGFSSRGVPVFMADIKGDLTGVTQAGGGNPKIDARNELLGITPAFEGFPATVWDVFGKQGHPLRATVSEMGPLLIARLLQLNDTQEGVLSIAFKYADDNGLMLLDLKDLQQLMLFVGENADQLTLQYGNVSTASVGAIQRGLLQIDEQGGDMFFGEPAVKLEDFMQTVSGKGVLNLLAADQLINAPKLYSTFLLWLLSELFESLPEAGDLDKPKLVSFLTKLICCFRTLRKPSSIRSSRSCALFAQRASAYISSPKTLPTSPKRCSPSSATAFSTHFAPTRRRNKRASRPPQVRSA